MNETLIRRFCESPRRGVIVTTVTILLGLGVITPMVDEYFDKKESRKALAEELDNARETAARLPSLEKQVALVVEKLSSQEGRTVSDETLSGYRTKLVEMVRESDCQIRRFDVATPTRRPWKEGDTPLRTGNSDSSGKATPYALERRSLLLSVSGRTQDIYSLLEKLQQDDTLVHPERIDIQSDGQGGDTVIMELEMILFALSRQSA